MHDNPLQKAIFKLFESSEKDWEKMDRHIDADPILSKALPSLKFHLKYPSLRAIEAEAEFRENKTKSDEIMHDLEARAREGQIVALRMLAFLATEATQALNKLANEDPRYLSIVAESMTHWPILVTETSARDKEVQELLKSVRLDHARTLGAPAKKIITENLGEAKKWAWFLLQSILSLRRMHGIRGEVVPTKWRLQKIDTEGAVAVYRLPRGEEFVERAKTLPLLEECSVKGWQELARDIMRAIIKNSPDQVRVALDVYAKNDKTKSAKSEAARANNTINRFVEHVDKSFKRLCNNKLDGK